MQPPEEVKLSREDGEALIERSKASNLASDDQGVVVKLMGVYFWLTLALEETKIGLRRLKVAVFGEGRKKRGLAGGGSGGIWAGAEASPAPAEPLPRPSAVKPGGEESSAERRRGHGRRGAEAYRGAEQVVLRCSQRCVMSWRA
jgi:hypothetical protein